MVAKKSMPKRVVYLWGAGATQGEAQHLGARISLLMRDTRQFGEGVTTRILKRAGATVASAFSMGQSGDIEKLISLLGVSGTDEHRFLAERMRTFYFEELRSSLGSIGLLENPQLAIRLLELHNDRRFESEVETLTGIISTNHDGLLQIASQVVFGGINLGTSFVSEYFAPTVFPYAPPLVQLHGSFTWQFGVPVQVSPLTKNSKYSPDTVWIPPTTFKEAKSYPFNKLAAFAYELLAERCDLLRVVGASLTQNDWNVLSLIFNAQRHRQSVKGSPFRIELIMPHAAGEHIAADCAYLQHLTPIGYLGEGRFAEYKEYYDGNQDIPPESDLANPFEYWLNQKLDFHRARRELDGSEARHVAQDSLETAA